MVYNGQGLCKINQGILIPIVVELRVKHKDLSFDDREENTMKNKITFVKVEYVAKLSCSLE